MKVVLTAPIPTSRTPSFPRAGFISTGCFTAGHYIMAARGQPGPIGSLSVAGYNQWRLRCHLDRPQIAFF